MRLFAGASIALALLATVGAPAHAADVEAGKRKAEACGACHGADGNATIPGTPSLAGQPVYFTHWQLIKYRDGRRKDPQMSPLAKNLTDTDMADLAAYFAAQRALPRPATTDPAKVAEGKRPPRRPGLRLPPPSPPRLQSQDRLGPRRHHDHGRPAPPRRRHRKPRPLHRQPRRLALTSSLSPPHPALSPYGGEGGTVRKLQPGRVGGCPPGTRIFCVWSKPQTSISCRARVAQRMATQRGPGRASPHPIRR